MRPPLARYSKAVAIAVIAATLSPGLALAAKTDVMILRNGDHVTGEVKGVSRGKLDYSTDDAGRLSIEWEKVAFLSSVHPFRVETMWGAKYFGTLGRAEREGFVAVVGPAADTLRIAHIVEMYPLNAGFVQRLQAYLDMGFTLAKANRAETFSMDGQLDYKGPAVGTQLTFSSYAQGQESSPHTTKNSARQTVSWYLPDRWSAVGLVQIEQNDELDLAHRITGGGAMSRVFIQTNHQELSMGAGIVGTQEEFDTETASEGTTSLEGLISATWDAFRFDSPKLDFGTSLALFPSLSQSRRIRGQFDLRVQYELFSDFNVGVRFSDTFDSSPPEEGTGTNDYVSTFTIGWSYRR